MNLQNRNKPTALESKLMVAKGKDRGKDRQFGMGMHITLLYLKKGNQQVSSVLHMELCSVYVAAWVGRESRGEDTCIYMAGPLHGPPETITTLLINCTLIQNEKFKKYNEMDILAQVRENIRRFLR